MKKFLMMAVGLVAGFAVMAQQKPEEVIKVNTDVHSFGKIKQNEPVTYYFELKNVSNKPVVIENTWGSCGCTTPGKIEQPIAPGATTRLKVDYNAAAVAPFEKEVYIKVAGIAQPKIVKIKGEVLEAKAWDAYVKTDEYKKSAAKNNGTKKAKSK
jgi:hypothetical protein